jgi:hypothetical protein
MQQPIPEDEIEDNPGTRPDVVASVREYLQDGSVALLRRITDSLKAPDFADLIELLEPIRRCSRNSIRAFATSCPKIFRTSCWLAS